MEIASWGEFSNPSGSVKLDLRKLEEIERELKKKYFAKVGIIGTKAEGRMAIGDLKKKGGHKKHEEKVSKLSNAEIGAIHEFGSITKHIPQRSFLRMPLWMKLPQRLKEVGPAIMAGLTGSNIKTAYKKLGVIGENIVQDAFETGGFGNWTALSTRTIAGKKSSAILIDTAQLRKSITSQVQEGVAA